LVYLVQNRAKTKPFKIIVKKKVSSTNDIAKKWLEPFGVIIADEQEEGRGRQQRRWFSPAGKNIYMTVLMPLPENFQYISLLPATVALAIRQSLTKTIPEIKDALFVKWPNDIYLHMKKLSGVLIERVSKKLFATGIGINVNMQEADIPPELQEKACSLQSFTGKLFHRGKIIEAVLNELLLYREKLIVSPETIVDKFNSISLTTNRKVLIIHPEGRFEALAISMQSDGSLRVKNEQGKHLNITSADIEIILQ